MTSSGPGNSRRSLTDFLVHVHPPTVPEETLRFTLSFALGGIAATLLFLLFGSGILQLLSYEPSINGAYGSVQAMYSQVVLSGWIRNIHYLSANLLVIVVLFHLLRVFLTGAMDPGRRLNWVIGLVLFFFILSANFSGYLLPWDQLAFWAVTICTSMMAYIPGIGPWLMELFRGGPEVGPATLANFYGLHIAVIPASLVLFTGWHFWLVRKSGGLVREKREDGVPLIRVPAVPDLIVREAAVGLGLIAMVMIAALLWNAPLHEPANPGMSPNPAKAPWYFLGFQELLLHLHPVFAICVVPLTVVSVLLLLPFRLDAVLPGGKWFGSRQGRVLARWSFFAGILLTFILVILDEKVFRTGGGAGTADLFSRGFYPLAVFLSGLVAGHQLLVRKFRFSRAEAVMSVFIFCCAILAALTVIGIWFRGPGMQLIWPWL